MWLSHNGGLIRLARMTPTELFSTQRPRLLGIAYRMLGVRADAEDVVQDAWLRWHGSNHAAIASGEAWLVTVVTRLAIDRLREARHHREVYPGEWLPEPLVQVDEHTPETLAEQASDLSVALLWVLERLGPEERAAFLLRQVFEHDYADVARVLDKSEAACRQLVHRAVERVRDERPRFTTDAAQHRRLLEGFVAASRSGDRERIKALLADDVLAVADGGGKVFASPRTLHGVHRIANLHWAQNRQLGARLQWRMARINGEPGLMRYVDGTLNAVLSFTTDGQRITGIYTVMNPDKLAGIGGAA